MAESAPLQLAGAVGAKAGPSAAALLERAFAGLTPEELLRLAIERIFPGKIALVSSFGAESAVLLHMVAAIDRATPVLFLDTGRLFHETLEHRDRLTEQLGLSDVRTMAPAAMQVATHDAAGDLHAREGDLCCHIRKIEPLERALEGFEAWITGRKHFQTAGRRSLRHFDEQDGRLKLNPLAHWTPQEIERYLGEHGLPRHPLVARGFPSIGCVPCTDRAAPGEADRAGRWRGRGKTECGIHQTHPGNRKL